LHEIYLPAFKAGIDAGAMAVMTSYNQLNGEYTGQSKAVITDLLRKQLGFKWLIMTDWWSVYDPVKVIKSGQNLEMPGHYSDDTPPLKLIGDIYLRTNAARLIKEGKVNVADIDRMAKTIMRTFIAAGMYDRPIKDDQYLEKFPAHEKLALETAREAIVMLRNEGNILPLVPGTKKRIVLTGEFVEGVPMGAGSAKVIGYNQVSMLGALTTMYGDALRYVKAPTEQDLKIADTVMPKTGLMRVCCDVKNTGKCNAKETVELYIHDIETSVPRPVKELKGFSKVLLAPGERKTVSFVVKEKDLAFWDTVSKRWKAEKGTFEVLIGSSSNDIRLTGKFSL
jgi:beta-glucosidase